MKRGQRAMQQIAASPVWGDWKAYLSAFGDACAKAYTRKLREKARPPWSWSLPGERR